MYYAIGMDPKTNKLVPYTDLTLGAVADVWTTALTVEERDIILVNFKPMGFSSDEATAQTVNSGNPVSIATVASHLKKEHIRDVGYKLLAIAECCVSERTNAASLHFYFQARAEFFYRWRNVDGFALDAAIEAMRQQIAIADHMAQHFLEVEDLGFVPAHHGYRQLRIIEERRGNFDLAIALCERAKAQGWKDDWDKQIARLRKKRAKNS